VALIAVPALVAAGMSIVAAGTAAAARTHATAGRYPTQYASQEHFTVPPNHVNMLDCNGWSKAYKSANPGFRRNCTDPKGARYGYNGWPARYHPKARFLDNGHYVGHDEPSVKFVSGTANSGNTMSYFMQLPKDPPHPPTNNGKITKYAELTGAAWFGLPICDPKSYPQNACTPDSDTNTGTGLQTDAGSAFMELQWYAPGFIPFQDNTSCSTTKYCVAMTIDSFSATFGFALINPNCVEPVNFAYLTKNGVPGGPPAPQTINGQSFTPTANTLEMNPGDVLKVSISDPSAGFTTTVTDVTTGVTGTMTASAANGFMNTNGITGGKLGDCSGAPFTFHAEYGTAAVPNQVPWAALEGGVLMEQEIGHNEVCASLIHHSPTHAAGLTDLKTFDTCVGGAEGAKKVGEGSCSLKAGPTFGVCQHPQTEGTTGPIACPSKSFLSPQLCEFADGTCLPQGPRTITLLGKKLTARMPVNFCQANKFQNGDLDYDGISYQKTSWPNGSVNTPTSFRYAGPFDAAGNPYGQIQFETDGPGSAFLCNTFTGLNCDVPPLAAHFYPYWTLTNKQGIGTLFPAKSCIWNFGNTIAGITTQAFGKDAQYGAPDAFRFGGTVITGGNVQLFGTTIPNPEVTGNCPALTQPH
jgi:hypothetical protein